MISTRRHLDEKIEADRRSNRDRFGFAIAVVVVGWIEIQRRLEGLNHEAARLQASQDTTVSADTYSANEDRRGAERDELREWQKTVDGALGRTSTAEGIAKERKNDTRSDRALIVAALVLCTAIISTVVILTGNGSI